MGAIVVDFETPHEAPFLTEGEAVRLKAEVVTAREAARLKSELVTTVSHELRTPLTSVLGFAELLLHRDLDEDTRTRYLQTIHGEARRLTVLIDDFLDLEKIEAGRFTLALEPFDLRELLAHEVEKLSAQSASHTLELISLDEPLVIVGDRNRIGQVIANLLSNAIKYSPAGGTVTITATARETFTQVQVRDHGLGIPSAQQAHVFTKFFRADTSDTRKIGGTGLGLTLCQQIVAAHGGQIGFESKEGIGSTFSFELPSAHRAGAPRSAVRVLLIEDDPALATLLAESLTADGLEVDLAATGQAGLERALALPPAVICLHVSKPGELDGWQVMVRLKANPATAHVPVIVCAGANGRGPAATLGASEFIAAPVTSNSLRQAVARQISAERSSVLVVGNDHALRRLVVETLARDGGALREAADGLEAVTMIAARQPDAVVIDLVTPGLEGFADLERLLDRPEIHGLPIVVLTGRELTAHERQFLQARSVSLVEKHEYSGDALRSLIHRRPASLAQAAAFAAYPVIEPEARPNAA